MVFIYLPAVYNINKATSGLLHNFICASGGQSKLKQDLNAGMSEIGEANKDVWDHTTSTYPMIPNYILYFAYKIRQGQRRAKGNDNDVKNTTTISTTHHSTSITKLFTMPMNPATKARLMREMSLLSKDPPPGIAAYTPNPADMTQIRAQITGPEGSPFETGVFLLTVHITARYPFEPPRCRFLTPLYHPNVDSHGRICLDTLKSPPAGSWSPAVSLPSLLLSIRSLMAEPNPDDGLVPEISELYKRNPAQWTKEAERRTKLDATVEKLEQLESDEKETKHDNGNEKEANTNIVAAAGSNNNNSQKDAAAATKKNDSSISNSNETNNHLEDSSENKRKFKKLKSSK